MDRVTARATGAQAPKTGTVPVLRPKGKSQTRGGSWAALAVLLLLPVVLLAPRAARAASEQDTVLEGSGIRYPSGFDVNTVGEVRGVVRALTVPDQGPVRFQVDTGTETYTVIASPRWFWEDLRADLTEGAEVAVRGSKTMGRNGVLYVVAQEVRLLSSDRSYTLRDPRGSPMWHGHGPGGMGGQQMGPGPGGGGMGGGMGRGRRR